jgi:hypothetical protein
MVYEALVSEFVKIPVRDVREGGPVRQAIDGRVRARALRDECLTSMPPPVRSLLPAVDAITRRWLARSASPYVADIEAIAAALGFPGIWFLNGTYEWGCTALARDQDGGPWLARTLDWPFHGLGRHLEVARMRGPAGEFFNVGWPGYAGTLTALAPGRFAIAVNQAPLRRRTRRPWLRAVDVVLNALGTWRVEFCPPAHLLRQVFENCRDFAEAKHRLEMTPIARPVIFTLAGLRHGERCVIERTEEGHSTHCEITAAANDWLYGTEPWEARVAPNLFWKLSREEAAARSRARRETLWSSQQGFGHDMTWLVPPVLNWFTRCAIEMCPARGILRVAGYEPERDRDLPSRVTEICELAGESLTVPA